MGGILDFFTWLLDNALKVIKILAIIAIVALVVFIGAKIWPILTGSKDGIYPSMSDTIEDQKNWVDEYIDLDKLDGTKRSLIEGIVSGKYDWSFGKVNDTGGIIFQNKTDYYFIYNTVFDENNPIIYRIPAEEQKFDAEWEDFLSVEYAGVVITLAVSNADLEYCLEDSELIRDYDNKLISGLYLYDSMFDRYIPDGPGFGGGGGHGV